VTDSAKPARKIDLDAARRARLEQRGPAPVVTVNGKDYELPAELPADVVTAFGLVQRGDVSALEAALEALFAGKLAELKADSVAAGAPLSWDDLVFLIESAVDEYGLDLPGSRASGS
jgi:hypothetical protein